MIFNGAVEDLGERSEKARTLEREKEKEEKKEFEFLEPRRSPRRRRNDELHHTPVAAQRLQSRRRKKEIERRERNESSHTPRIAETSWPNSREFDLFQKGDKKQLKDPVEVSATSFKKKRKRRGGNEQGEPDVTRVLLSFPQLPPTSPGGFLHDRKRRRKKMSR